MSLIVMAVILFAIPTSLAAVTRRRPIRKAMLVSLACLPLGIFGCIIAVAYAVTGGPTHHLPALREDTPSSMPEALAISGFTGMSADKAFIMAELFF